MLLRGRDKRTFQLAYGTKDLEAADYRACADYGPLY